MLDRRQFLKAGAAVTLGAGAAAARVGRRGSVAGAAPPTGAGAAGPAIAIPPGALKDLRDRLAGALLFPGTAGYLAASQPANGRYMDVRPAAVAVCANEADVVTCVTWCVENGVLPTARGGGHSYAGYSTTPQLLVNLGALNGVAVDLGSATAVCGGAALNQNFYNATHDGPLYLPSGTCLGVGVGGLALGGGIGYNTHWAGLTSDHMLASRVVTASGEVLEVDEHNNSDLYWACRGGAGGSFGLNTQFTFSMVEVPTSVSFYRFDYVGAEAAAAVLKKFDKLLATAPPALNAVAAATAVEGSDPSEAIEVFTRGQYIGPPEELFDLVEPLLHVASPVWTQLQAMSFWDVIRLINTAEPPSHCFGDISRYAAQPVPSKAVDAIVNLLIDCPSRSDTDNGSIWSLGWVGGSVVDAIGRTETAYVHRGMTTLLRPTTVWSDDAPPSVGDDLNAWTNEVIGALDPYTPDESYQNFPNRMIDDWQQAYYAENFPRLVEIKTKYDPQNLFRNAQSIPTSTST